MQINDTVRVIAPEIGLPMPQYLYANKVGQVIGLTSISGETLYRVQFSREDSYAGVDYISGVLFYANEIQCVSNEGRPNG